MHVHMHVYTGKRTENYWITAVALCLINGFQASTTVLWQLDIAKLFHFALPQQAGVVQDHNPDKWVGKEIHDGKSIVVCVMMGESNLYSHDVHTVYRTSLVPRALPVFQLYMQKVFLFSCFSVCNTEKLGVPWGQG